MLELIRNLIPLKMKEAHSTKNWTQEKLLSYVINSDKAEKKIDQMATQIANQFKSVQHLMTLDESSLATMEGFSPTKAKQIVAMHELFCRWSQPNTLPVAIRKSADAVPYFDPIKYLSHEEFHVLYLNRAHTPLYCASLFKGGITGTITDIRIVMKRALQLNATAMIVAHNHPSGALVPSENDKRMTRKLIAAAKTLDLALLDHLIITASGYFSFSDQGLM